MSLILPTPDHLPAVQMALRHALSRILRSTTGRAARAAIVAATGRRGVLVEGLTEAECAMVMRALLLGVMRRRVRSE